MSWWSPSWLPALPSIDFSLPSGIQRRFISFALRRSLGHLLKPGQLEAQQVDSQIGSGYVQVRDLELDNDAINALIAGLPVRLHDGSLSKVTARVPWPNPLTSTIGLSIESLHLIFHLAPTLSEAAPPSSHNLAESVASVAETFIHEELSPTEEATLRHSFHPDLAASSQSLGPEVPGGLDPFVTDDETFHGDADIPGVSIFATLVERLLARFEFEAVDTRITLVHPGHASFTLKIPEIRYGYPNEPDSSSPGTTRAASGDAARAVSISGVTLTTLSLRPPSPQAMTPTQASPVRSHQSISPEASHIVNCVSPSVSESPASPRSDSSEFDEDTQMLMSQSIAVLPPRPVSPTSAASSMYQSAISSPIASFARDPSHHFQSEPEQRSSRPPSPPSSTGMNSPSSAGPQSHSPIIGMNSPSSADPQSPPSSVRMTSPTSAGSPSSQRLLPILTDNEEETIFSIASEPITIHFTPPITAPGIDSDLSPSSDPNVSSQGRSETEPGHSQTRPFTLSISLGVPACALQARHIRSIIDIAQSWGSHSPQSTDSSETQESRPSSTSQSVLQADLQVRGAVLILLPDAEHVPGARNGLADFFSRPLLPPRLPHGFVRIFLEGLSVSLSKQSVAVSTFSRTTTPRAPNVTLGISTSTSLTTTLHDMSVIAFLATRDFSENEPSTTYTASPILITDPYLSSQYPLTRIDNAVFCTDQDQHQLSHFDIIDWTSPSRRNETGKLSHWRTKPQRHIPTISPSQPSALLAQDRGATISVHGSPRPRTSELPRTIPSAPARTLFGSPRSPGSPSPLRPGTSPREVSSLDDTLGRSSSAMIVEASWTSPSGKTGHDQSGEVTLDVSFGPLHLYADLGLLLRKDVPSVPSEATVFLEEITGKSEDTLHPQPAVDQGDSDNGDDDLGHPDSRPATPRAHREYHTTERERDSERERRRLERLILEDLDLTYDYRDGDTEKPRRRPAEPSSAAMGHRKRKRRSKKSSSMAITVKFSAIRAEVRVPPPPSRTPRSGALILDIHDLCLSPGQATVKTDEPRARFRQVDDPAFPEAYDTQSAEDVGTPLLTAGWKRIVLAHSLVGEEKAYTFVALCADGLGGHSTEGAHLGSDAPAISPDSQSQRALRVTRSSPATVRSGLRSSPLVVALDISSVLVELSKPVLDGLQIWADDIAQFVEHITSEISSSKDTAPSVSAQTSMIGSRYFARGSGSTASGSLGASNIHTQPQSSSETVIKLGIQETIVRLLVPRKAVASTIIRPFHIMASDVDLLLELKPEGKDETVLTLGVSGIDIQDVDKSGSHATLLCMTNPHDLDSAVRPALKVRFVSLTVPETVAKESRVKLTICGLTCNVLPEFDWVQDLATFAKAPPGVFESVVPSERTRVSLKLADTSVRIMAARHPGALVSYFGELDFSTDIVGDSPEMEFNCGIASLSLYFLDDLKVLAEDSTPAKQHKRGSSSGSIWRGMGYALLAELSGAQVKLLRDQAETPASVNVTVVDGDLRLHMCADTMGALIAFVSGIGPAPDPADPKSPKRKRPTEPANLASPSRTSSYMLSSLDEYAFQKLPEVGAAPDMIQDDLPRNPEYLDDFGAAAGLKELSDDELDEFDNFESTPVNESDDVNVISRFGGETIKMLGGQALRIVEEYFENITPEPVDGSAGLGDSTLHVKVQDCNATLFLYDGYDWARTRRTIEEGRKEMKRKLAKIKQLVASGQTPDPSVEETSALLFNSVYVGLEHGIDELEPAALIAAIDEELNDDETASHSSWQSLKPQQMSSPGRAATALPTSGSRRSLARSRAPGIEFRFSGLNIDQKKFKDGVPLVSRLLVCIQDVDILDHIKTSTWRKFLTTLREDSRGNIREAGSNMVRIELRSVHPVPDHPSEEARLRAKILPLRLHVDQDALDFLKKFFSFKDPDASPAPSSDSDSDEIYFQQAEVFPVDIKLDYKPRRVDYRALRDGRTIELMNFFHFDGAEMTLRHITLNGITGWARMFDLLNDLWTPDVKATQLVDVISGVSPIRSVVNVGSGVADLVLLPIAQYKKDGRVYRGLQKGTKAFVKSTAMEAIRLGARLATGTQVILEQAETVLGGQFEQALTAEAVSTFVGEPGEGADEDADLISRYAEQPMNVREGVQSAYKSLKRNFSSAAQTILAVPMEVYERSGNEGPVRAVVRAVPIAVLKPMIGASEAVSKTLMGIHNQLDPGIRAENEAKYKQR
ncbi:hypothetical protein OBBRIDRAFT_869049 [Obba rivulosa]|uniref:Autophagy-related protein 2 n=1 Tax=Obba rivulosa TaxID=1052685 RepID=A0A8E2B4E6_9APHY|nr:hypothetical protein OBBRIDRAFT_869049 [Obba rivulosa]